MMSVEYSLRQRRRLWLYTFVCPAIDKYARIVRDLASPEELFDNPPDVLSRYVGEQQLARMRRLNSEQYIDALLERLRMRGVTFVCRGDAEYPECLEELADIIIPPELLFVRGNRDLNVLEGIAVVGTRKCSPEGAGIARGFGRDFAQAGAQLITGMAVGIDAAAVEGALDGGGRVIGVLGCGVDVPYPADNQVLVRRLLESGGSLISEYMPGMHANHIYFPVRNRIIAGLARGTLIVEAPARSGALNTASHALNMGREVFVVPGSILDARYAGSNALLLEGAAPALTSFDVLEPLGIVGLDDRDRFGALDVAETYAPSDSAAGFAGKKGDATLMSDADARKASVSRQAVREVAVGCGTKPGLQRDTAPADAHVQAAADGHAALTASPEPSGAKRNASNAGAEPVKPAIPARASRKLRASRKTDHAPTDTAAADAQSVPRRAMPELTEDERRIVELLQKREHSFDEMISQTDFDTARLNSLLTMLKIKRIIYETTGKHFRIDDALR